jgi:hypothetical protein
MRCLVTVESPSEIAKTIGAATPKPSLPVSPPCSRSRCQQQFPARVRSTHMSSSRDCLCPRASSSHESRKPLAFRGSPGVVINLRDEDASRAMISLLCSVEHRGLGTLASAETCPAASFGKCRFWAVWRRSARFFGCQRPFGPVVGHFRPLAVKRAPSTVLLRPRSPPPFPPGRPRL